MTPDAKDGSAALRESLDRLLATHDRPGAVMAALDAVDAGRIDIPQLYTEVLTPLMVSVGGRWQSGDVRVWEEHLYSAAVRDVVDALYPRVLAAKAALQPADRAVLLACPHGEGHDLGLRMLSDLFDLAGWTTYLLGPDVPNAEIVDAARTLAVDLVLLTSATHFHRVRIRHVLDELRDSLQGVRLVVAGPAWAADTAGLRDDEVFHAAEFLGDVAPVRSDG